MGIVQAENKIRTAKDLVKLLKENDMKLETGFVELHFCAEFFRKWVIARKLTIFF